MSPPASTNLTIDGVRLWSMLMETAQIGGTAKGGICRLALSDEDRRVRDWLKSECEALGCSITIDAMGNMFALRAGRADIPPIALGSHLDTQPTGGKFDGVLGVLAALEVFKTLAAAGYETHAPLLLVNWTNEEGSRFAPAMLGSGVFAGAVDQPLAEAREDRQGTRFGDALGAIGYRGAAVPGSVALGALFELHIEQGPILEAEGKTIGIVEGVQGIRWYEVTILGRESHTGSTPMAMRRDALLAAAGLVQGVEAMALAEPPGVGTVGLVEVRPNSPNVIPGEVFLTVDLRHPDAAALDRMEAALERAVAAAQKEGVSATWIRISDTAPVAFDAGCIDCVAIAAERAGYAARRLISGPGHDAAHIARIAPTTMIFVPCKDGISHNEAEETSPAECTAGAQVLLEAILEYDRRLAAASG